MPPAIEEYISTHRWYKEYTGITSFYPSFGLTAERIEHTYRTAQAAISLAKKFNVRVSDAITAVLLHDIGKYVSKKKLCSACITIPKEVYNLPEKIQHAPISAAIAEQYFSIKNPEILDAIANHTTGAANMSPLAKVVYLADAIEAGRDYPALKSIRRKAFTDLNKGMLAMLKSTIDFVSQTDTVYYKTIEAYSYYKQLQRKPRTATKKNTVPAEKVQKSETKKALPQQQPKTFGNEANTKNASPASAAATMNPNDSPESLAQTIGRLLLDKKAKDIVLIDIAGKTIIADYFVVASASSTTAVKALCDYVDEKLSKDYGIEPLRRDIDSKWAAVDYGSVILHILHDEARSFYQLERLWDNGTNCRPISE